MIPAILAAAWFAVALWQMIARTRRANKESRASEEKVAEIIADLKSTWTKERKRLTDAHEAELRALNFLLKTNYGIEIHVVRGTRGVTIEAQADVDAVERFANRREGK